MASSFIGARDPRRKLFTSARRKLSLKRDKVRPWIAFMRLKANKTWSQHQLSAKLRVEGGGKEGVLTFERRRLLATRFLSSIRVDRQGQINLLTIFQ